MAAEIVGFLFISIWGVVIYVMDSKVMGTFDVFFNPVCAFLVFLLNFLGLVAFLLPIANLAKKDPVYRNLVYRASLGTAVTVISMCCATSLLMVDTNQRTHAFYTENSSDYWSLCAAIFVLGGMINISLAHRDDVIICRFLVSMWKIVSVVRLSSFERSTARNIPQTGLPSSTPLSPALSLTA
eukprot:CAMPEP_0185787878 /NCGR_PEP_ID=MMETSP1174-20130828/143192_1 /TAXON_ID=35687 /ORGANISM="Dictyocha speculum, Strain CCMP1381" /LENGTH=182 /DNA_ID=CAMNT_0028481265 /DNA_START=72 /DNA_END=616 /DNA_ORIENTATION=+